MLCAGPLVLLHAAATPRVLVDVLGWAGQWRVVPLRFVLRIRQQIRRYLKANGALLYIRDEVVAPGACGGGWADVRKVPRSEYLAWCALLHNPSRRPRLSLCPDYDETEAHLSAQ